MLHHTYIHTSKLRSDERGSGITAVGGCVSLVGAHEHLMEVGKPDLPLAFMFRVTGTLGAVVSHESILILGGWGVGGLSFQFTDQTQEFNTRPSAAGQSPLSHSISQMSTDSRGSGTGSLTLV